MKAYWQLIRPGIVAMVLFTIGVAALTTGDRVPALAMMMWSLFGSALVIMGAIALNQRLEYAGDAKMGRTAERPLPSGRLSNR